jgi:Na+-transporting NADH:ubiquinone oxidoreductase subunit NqrE
MTIRHAGLLNRYFYFSMSLLIAVIVVYGFSHTIDHNLLHATPRRPWILGLHAVVFSGWVIFFIVQSALVRTHNVRVHRTLGWFGAALGTVIPILGISTAISMGRFFILHAHSVLAAPFLVVQFCDMTSFAVPFALAIYWRNKPEFHRRLVLMASCTLTAAAFARFPLFLVPAGWFYVGVDLLILLGVVRDLIVSRRVHPAYLYGLPVLILAQSCAMYVLFTKSPHWLKIANAILR